mmetsp:Transcript_66077/g.144301  ORF Transcript_66077/g.144301 Transcript_66077/m.144301 type:complete len:275 (+) Transcript_66077:121-945(+)
MGGGGRNSLCILCSTCRRGRSHGMQSAISWGPTKPSMMRFMLRRRPATRRRTWSQSESERVTPAPRKNWITSATEVSAGGLGSRSPLRFNGRVDHGESKEERVESGVNINVDASEWSRSKEMGLGRAVPVAGGTTRRKPKLASSWLIARAVMGASVRDTGSPQGQGSLGTSWPEESQPDQGSLGTPSWPFLRGQCPKFLPCSTGIVNGGRPNVADRIGTRFVLGAEEVEVVAQEFQCSVRSGTEGGIERYKSRGSSVESFALTIRGRTECSPFK